MAPKRGKTMLDIMKEVRNEWTMNPRTRVQEDERKDIKKRRQSEKKLIKRDSGE